MTVQQPPADRMINVATAAALAKRAGTPVQADTIRRAASRGAIAGAVRAGTRWTFPAWAFEDWLMVHVSRADYVPAE